MAFNGSGVFIRSDGFLQGSNVCAQQLATGVNMVPERFDTMFNSIATALGQCVTKDGQTGGISNHFNANSFKVVNLAAGTELGEAVNKGQLDGVASVANAASAAASSAVATAGAANTTADSAVVTADSAVATAGTASSLATAANNNAIDRVLKTGDTMTGNLTPSGSITLGSPSAHWTNVHTGEVRNANALNVVSTTQSVEIIPKENLLARWSFIDDGFNIGVLQPPTNNTHRIGSTTARVHVVYANSIRSGSFLDGTGGPITIDTGTGGAILLNAVSSSLNLAADGNIAWTGLNVLRTGYRAVTMFINGHLGYVRFYSSDA